MQDLNKRIESADKKELERLQLIAAAQRTEALLKLKEAMDNLQEIIDRRRQIEN